MNRATHPTAMSVAGAHSKTLGLSSKVFEKLETYKALCKKFGVSRKNPDLNRNASARVREWIPRRYCEDEYLLCVWCCHSTRNIYRLGLFLSEDHRRFVRDAGAMGGLIFNLSEAYDKTGMMEVHFVGPPEGHELEVPESVRRVAYNLGLKLQHKHHIADEEGRLLYARLTGLSEKAVQSLTARGVDLVKACFTVHRGLWTKEQVELIALQAHAPERIFTGNMLAEHRVQYLHDMLLLRVAVLAERLQTLCSSVHGPNDQVVTAEWTEECRLAMTLHKPVGWTHEGREIKLPAKARILATLTARDAKGYEVFGSDDVQAAASAPEPRLLVLTRDFDWVREVRRKELITQAAKASLPIVQVVDTIGEMDANIDERIARVVSTRRGAPERPD